jgi:hypothetical protein
VQDLIALGRWKDWAGNWRKVGPFPFTFGLGIEFESGGHPATHTITAPDGESRTLPSAGLIVMPDWSFWTALRDHARECRIEDMTNHLFEVRRSGPRGKHTFGFSPVGPAAEFPIPTEVSIDLGEVLDELVSVDRLRTYIGPLADGHCFWKY